MNLRTRYPFPELFSGGSIPDVPASALDLGLLDFLREFRTDRSDVVSNLCCFYDAAVANVFFFTF